MLGFSLLKDTFQFVDIQYQDGKPVVNQFAKKAPPIPFDIRNVLDETCRVEFRFLIEEAINHYDLEGATTLAVDSNLAMVRKLIVDLVFPEDQLEDQLNWEIRQILPEDSLLDYQYVYEVLPASENQDHREVLLVLFRKEILEKVTGLFLDTPLDIRFVELDIFSSINGINRLMGIRELDTCFLVDMRKDSINFITTRRGEFFDLFHLDLEDDSEENGIEVYESNESLARLLNKHIRRKLLEYKMEVDENPPEAIFLFGERATMEVVEQLKENSPARDVWLMEPFKKMELKANIEKIPENSSAYMVCIGSALRSLL